MRNPKGSCAIVAIEKAEAPPPLGSTAVKKCCVFRVGLRTSYRIAGHSRSMKFCTSTDEKHFSEPSAEIPSDCDATLRGGEGRVCGVLAPMSIKKRTSRSSIACVDKIVR